MREDTWLNIYIQGDYLHTKSYEEVIIILKGRLVGILVNIYLKINREFVVLEKVVKVLYLNLKVSLWVNGQFTSILHQITNRLEK